MAESLNIAIGVILIFTSLCYIILYAITLLVIARSKEIIAMPCYRIMFALGLSDMSQVFFLGFIAGIDLISGGILSYAINRLFGCVLIASWYIELFLAFLLAFNRLLTVTFGQNAKQIFGNFKVFIWISIAVFYGIAQFFYYMFGNVDLTFSSESYTWYYGNSTESSIGATVEIISDTIMVASMAICYIFIGVTLKTKRSVTTSQSLTKNDMRALLCAFLIASNIVGLDIFFFVAPTLSDSIWISFFCNFLWLVTAGNPIK